MKTFALFNPFLWFDEPTRLLIVRYLKGISLRRSDLIVPTLLGFLGAVLEGVSFALLIPLTSLFSEGGLSTLSEDRWFSWIPGMLPASMQQSAEGDLYLVLVIVSLLLGARFMRLLVGYARARIVHRRDEALAAELEGMTFRRVLGFGRGYFEKTSLGRVDTEIQWSRSVVQLVELIERFVWDVFHVAAKVAVLLALSVPLTLALVVGLPATMKLLHGITRRIERLSGEGVQLHREARSRILDVLGSVPLLKALHREEEAASSYEQVLSRITEVNVKRRNAMASRWPVEEAVLLTAIFAIQGGLMWASSDPVPAQIASFAAFLVVFQNVLPEMRRFGERESALAQLRPQLDALVELWSDRDKQVVAGGTMAFSPLRTAVDLRDLNFAYTAGQPVLKSVNASIPAGKVTGIVGPTGAGKTTLVDLIARFYEIEPGSIFFDGIDALDFSLGTFYREVALVSQHVWLLNRTLRDNLLFGLDRTVDDEELLLVLGEVRLDDLLIGDDRGLDTLIGDRGVQLSGGQRQRLAIARAILRDPSLLILDEATSALDQSTALAIAEVLERRFADRTVIIVTHRIPTLRHADHIMVMRDGRLAQSGTWIELENQEGEFRRLLEVAGHHRGLSTRGER